VCDERRRRGEKKKRKRMSHSRRAQSGIDTEAAHFPSNKRQRTMSDFDVPSQSELQTQLEWKLMRFAQQTRSFNTSQSSTSSASSSETSSGLAALSDALFEIKDTVLLSHQTEVLFALVADSMGLLLSSSGVEESIKELVLKV